MNSQFLIYKEISKELSCKVGIVLPKKYYYRAKKSLSFENVTFFFFFSKAIEVGIAYFNLHKISSPCITSQLIPGLPVKWDFMLGLNN